MVIEDSHIGTLAAKRAGMRYRADLVFLHMHGMQPILPDTIASEALVLTVLIASRIRLYCLFCLEIHMSVSVQTFVQFVQHCLDTLLVLQVLCDKKRVYRG